MISTPITLPPTAPTRNDPDNFRIRADAFLSWLANTFPDEINQVITDFNATIQNLFVATSTSSVAVGTGSKTFTVAETNLAFGVGMELRIAETTDPTVNYMDGIITAYDKTAKTVTVTVSAAEGSGTITAWTLTCKPRDFSSRVQTWSTLSGPAAPPLIAYHDGTYWPLVSALADATASEPGAGNTDWGGFGQLLKYEEITSSVAAWSPHPQARWLTVEVVAGGGSGAKYDGYACGGGGGMGIIVTFPVGRMSFPVAVLVGAGGASVGGENKREKGHDGGDSSFGPLVMSGGKFGEGNSSASISNVFFPGAITTIDQNPRHRVWSFCMPRLGSTASLVTTIFGGGSGGSQSNYYGTSLMHGRGGQGNTTDQAGQNGEDGQWPGGGGGAARGSFTTNKYSGAGANGVVRIWQY